MSFSIFENNYYNDGVDGFDAETVLSISALIVSGLSIYFTFRAITASKRAEISHTKFQDLCLSPVKVELDSMLNKLISNEDSDISNQINLLNLQSREFSFLLVRIRKIYNNIDVSELQDMYNEFTDYCLQLPREEKTGNVIEKFQSVRFAILSKVYEQAMDNIHPISRIFRKWRRTN